MAPRLQELCCLFVEDACGDACSQIFASLAVHGRSSRLQLLKRTHMPDRQLRSALVVLAQHHIIHHYTSKDNEITYYQVDWRNAYCLIRSSSIISLTAERYGEGAGRLAAHLLQLGHANVADLAQAFDLTTAAAATAAKCDNGVESRNEHAGDGTEVTEAGPSEALRSKVTTTALFHHTLRTLLRAGVVVKLDESSYTPPTDFDNEIEAKVIEADFKDGKVTGPKKQAEFKRAVNDLKRKRKAANEYSNMRDIGSKGQMGKPSTHPNKRTRLNGILMNGHDGDELHLHEENVPKLPSDMIVRINYARCALSWRSGCLEQQAESCLGGVTAHVYGALLQVLEGKLSSTEDNVRLDDNTDDDEDAEERLPTATTVEVAEVLDPTLDLTAGVLGAAGREQVPNGTTKRKKKDKKLDIEFADIGIKAEVDSDNDDDEDHPADGPLSYQDQHSHSALVEMHLRLLEEHSKGFCQRVGGGGRGEWRINFPVLTDTLIHAEIDATVLTQYGKGAMRLVRMLRERGKLDEKHIADKSLMKMKDIREVLSQLFNAGIVEMQEVPRDAARQPNRTIYLWSHDTARFQSVLLQQTYQGMSRALQRLKHERGNFKNVIEKAELMDMHHESLTQNERETLTRWREIEEKLLAQVQRMDGMVALLRDCPGKDGLMIL